MRASTATARRNDIYNALTITLENGALVNLASTGATPLCERNYEVRVFGAKAILQLELWRGTMALIDFDGHRTDFPPLTDGEVYPEPVAGAEFCGCHSRQSRERFARRTGPRRDGNHRSRL